MARTTIKQLALSFAAASAMVLAACSATTQQIPAESHTTAAPALVKSDSIAPTGYILLSDPNVVAPIEVGEGVFGLHVNVALTNHGYVPVGNVEGSGRLCKDGKDWLSISDLKVHTAAEGSPVAPYLLGCATKTAFTPSTRAIVR